MRRQPHGRPCPLIKDGVNNFQPADKGRSTPTVQTAPKVSPARDGFDPLSHPLDGLSTRGRRFCPDSTGRFVEQGRDGTSTWSSQAGVAQHSRSCWSCTDGPFQAGNTYSPCPVTRRSSRRITIAWRASNRYRRHPIARATNLLARGLVRLSAADTTCVSSQHEL